MRSEPARLGGISLDFAGIRPRLNENFPYEQAQVGQPKIWVGFYLNNGKRFLLEVSF